MEVEKKDERGVDRKPSHFGAWVAVRRPFRVDSPFFAAGNVERELLAKQVFVCLFFFCAICLFLGYHRC